MPNDPESLHCPECCHPERSEAESKDLRLLFVRIVNENRQTISDINIFSGILLDSSDRRHALKKILFVLLLVVLTGSSAAAQSKSKGGVCVWVDSEGSGSIMASQPGGAVLPITKAAVSRIQQIATNSLRPDTSNVVLETCPQNGENIELDVVVGQFRGGYVASVSVTIQGGNEGPIHVSSNVIAASTERMLAADIALAYASLKFRVATGLGNK